jgi:hypothetical protein
MDNIILNINNNNINFEIDEFNILIENIFLCNDYKKLILILELMNYKNKILFLKNNVENLLKILPLSYIIHLSITKQIYFSYNKINMLSNNFKLNLEVNKNKRFPNYSLKINNKNILILKKTKDYLYPIINNIKIEEDKCSLNILNSEYKFMEFNLLNNILPNILINDDLIEYFLFLDRNLFFIKKFIFYKNKFNKITNIDLNTILINNLFYY